MKKMNLSSFILQFIRDAILCHINFPILHHIMRFPQETTKTLLMAGIFSAGIFYLFQPPFIILTLL